ncbi:MAG: hypothetical protein Q8L29_01215 [archaeon]|nr:hypothetical protein [archaeon]
MAIDIHKLIAAIRPEVYCNPPLIKEVKAIAKEKGYLEAAKKVKLKESAYMEFGKAVLGNAFNLEGIKNPIEKHTIVYDSFGENLEPVYFWILDSMNKMGMQTTKFVDNFISSPGSAHFSEMGARATRMQEEGMKILGGANQVIKSILNIIYDLKEFQVRLELYSKIKSNNKSEKEAAMLSLKQIWLDQVDMKRGNTSIKAMALGQGAQFVTLIDAFMMAENENLMYKGQKIDLNETVTRIVKQRIVEFSIWLKESERELKKRFEIEKLYLRSQVNTVKLYARWAKPYLKAAKALEQRGTETAALVTAFNTTLFEMALLGEGKYDPIDDVYKGDLPKVFKTATTKKYSPILIVEFQFRSVPERTQQGYGFRGRLEATFTSYALTKEEIKVLKQEVEKDDLGDMLTQIEGATEESLAQINTDIAYFLEDKKSEEKKKEEKKNSEDDNPFSAIFSLFFPKKKEQKSDKKTILTPDTELEKVIRSQAIIESRKGCSKFYEIYKKVHSMPSFPTQF